MARARKKKRKSRSCLGSASGGCSQELVTTAKKQASRMLSEAERDTRPKCAQQLSDARSAFAAAQEQSGSVLDKRNAYIRATFLAGQAKSCSTVDMVGPRQTKSRKRKGV